MTRVLLVEDDRPARELLSKWCDDHDLRVAAAKNCSQAREHMQEREFDLAIVDLKLPDGDGLELIQRMPSSTSSFVMSGLGSIDRAVEAMRAGALDYFRKPVDLERLEDWVERIRESRADGVESSFCGMYGQSEKMQELFRSIRRAAESEHPVLLLGESGTGKELAARAIHRCSPRRGERFEAVNCGAIPEQLFESEMFGHEKGAFTGADRARAGAFERADGGTLFLDEITELPSDMQVKLLRVLETSSVRRVGGMDAIDFSVRVIAASNRDISEAVAAGDFREDLMFRLAVLNIELPPLREREGDIEMLTKLFLTQARQGRRQKTISEEAMRRLRAHSWPGNVRELANAVRRAYEMSAGDEIQPGDIALLRMRAEDDPFRLEVGLPLREIERRLILGTLRDVQDKRTAAKILGVSLKTIYNKLNEYIARKDPLVDPSLIKRQSSAT